MLKSCNKCGLIHDYNHKCYKNEYRVRDSAYNIRKTNKWKSLSIRIRERDKYLCKVCLFNLYDTTRIYNYNQLEVHHITPIVEDNSKAFDEDNLITLCSYHHKLAEDGTIPRNLLYMLASEMVRKSDVDDFLLKNTIPPYVDK